MPDDQDHPPTVPHGGSDEGSPPPADPPADRRPPISISAAVFLMYSGAAFLLVTFVLTLVYGSSVARPMPVIVAILWTITARINRLGLPSARPVALMFGILGIAFYIAGMLAGTPAATVGYALAIVHAVTVLGLLFTPASSAYFASMRIVLRGYTWPGRGDS